MLVILALDCFLHESHPDGQRGFGSGFLFTKRLAAVETYPHTAGDGWREAQEPGVGIVAGRAGFTT